MYCTKRFNQVPLLKQFFQRNFNYFHALEQSAKLHLSSQFSLDGFNFSERFSPRIFSLLWWRFSFLISPIFSSSTKSLSKIKRLFVLRTLNPLDTHYLLNKTTHTFVYTRRGWFIQMQMYRYSSDKSQFNNKLEMKFFTPATLMWFVANATNCLFVVIG